ncbi:MAG TPA: AMP-binding protein [Gammaproteobacteria bacterium]|nr:AMP-binding protein [Gammaproteobacteria bacterium]
MPEAARLPSAEDCVVRALLIRRAAEQPDHEFLLFDGGPRWTFSETLARVERFAAGLQAQGVHQGDFVLSWQGNSPTAVTTFLSLNFLGAVYVPINTGYRGALLEHVIRNSGARVMIADGALLDRLNAIDTAQLETVVVGDERPSLEGIRSIGAATLTRGLESTRGREPTPALESTPARDPADSQEAAGDGVEPGTRDEPAEIAIEPWDTHMVIYTSGTTGPSKGVLSSYIHSYTAATGFRNIGPGDRSLLQLPMFHVGGPYALLWALIHAGSAVVVDRFSVSRFWETVRRYEITTVGLLGAMVQFLMKQPETAADRDHPLRSVIIAPFDESAIAFGKRFGVPTYTEFNMTELSVPLWAGPDPELPGTCGKPVPGVELRIVDNNDIEVPPGTAGELVVRPELPWTMSHGYLNDPEATAKAWRNGWFHTGDLFRRDEDDNYFFVDRLKDAIRRRGENISSFEVERAILQHPDIREAAVVPVPGAGGEDDVLAVIALKPDDALDDDGSPNPGSALKPASLVGFLRNELADFMIPRYVRVLNELPKTPTQKVEKHRLRAEGVTADTWDREASGGEVGRNRA